MVSHSSAGCRPVTKGNASTCIRLAAPHCLHHLCGLTVCYLIGQLSEEELETLKEQLSIWKRLRHDLERVRMLAELSRLREKQKREMVRPQLVNVHTYVRG